MIFIHNERYRILVATDIVARGIDIHHVKHVINYDMPESSEALYKLMCCVCTFTQDGSSYFFAQRGKITYRIGRTGRHGGTGDSLCLILPNERRKHDLIKNGRSGAATMQGNHHTLMIESNFEDHMMDLQTKDLTYFGAL